MIRFLTIIVMLAPFFLANRAAAQVSTEALEACQRQETSFPKIEACLPSAQVAIEVLAATKELYGENGSLVVDHCLERNPDNVSGAATCVSNAIESAVRLAEMLPEGSAIDDPIFETLRDTAKQEELQSVEDAAQDKFPNQMMWGGGLYFPYDL